MGFLGDVSTNLLAAMIGAVALAVWQMVRRWRRFRGPRKFWAPFLTAECICVTGNMSPQILSETLHSNNEEAVRTAALLPVLQEHIREQELSGIMGRGDHDAVVQVQAGLARFGLESTVPERAGRLSGEELRKNLVVVGGPDVNSTTATLLERLPCQLVVTRNDEGRNIVRDLVHGQDYGPSVDPAGRPRDYGILVRAKNPDDPTKVVLILAGAHGFGSLAAAVVAFSNAIELQRQWQVFDSDFECLVCHERGDDRDDSPSRSSLVFSRRLSSPRF